MASVERSKLWVTDIEILRLHYAKTLRAWEQRFQANRKKIMTFMDERFCRMWEFYLIASELSFTHGSHMVFQMQIAKETGNLADHAGLHGKGRSPVEGLDQLADKIILFGVHNAHPHHVAGLQ